MQGEKSQHENKKHSLEIVAKFQYLGTTPAPSLNCIHEESQCGLNAGNTASVHTSIYLFSSLLYNNMKIKINRIILKWILIK